MRPRNSSSTRRLPQNLYLNGGYYRYRDPITGKFHGLGKDRQHAIAVATQANAHLAVSTQERVQEIISPGKAPKAPFDQLVRVFLEEHHRVQSWGKSKEQDYRRLLNELEGTFHDSAVDDISLSAISEYLDAHTGWARINRRGLMIWLWELACSKGWSSDNLPAKTLKRPNPTKARKRLNYDQFLQIRELAAPWFRQALDLALYTLQRRGDLVSLTTDNIVDGCLLIAQAKTSGRSEAGFVRIRIEGDLQQVISDCRKMPVASKYLLRRRKAATQGKAKVRTWHQVSAQDLSREFKRLRDKLPCFEGTEPSQRPTFHEIRALGADLLKQQGVPTDDIRCLMGHSKERMTTVYLKGHGEPRWNDARPLSVHPTKSKK